MRNFPLLSLVMLLNSPSFAAATSLQLAPRDVIPMVLKQSPQAKEIQIQARQAEFTRAETEKAFDFSLSATTGYQLSKFESSSYPLLEETKTWSTTATLAKPFQTGTTLSLQYTGTTDQPKPSSGSPADSSTNTAGLLLEQNLWRNFFGQADRASLRSADASVQSSLISQMVNLQDLALTALQAYWSAYVGQETLDAAIKSQNRYQKLIDSIQKKTRYGYANPAELAQAQAELENRLQKVRTETANSLLAMAELRTLLGVDPGTEIQFSIPKEVASPPSAFQPIQIERARPIQAAELSVIEADETLNKVKSQSDPDVSLIAQYYVQGLDESTSRSQDEMSRGTHPKYFVGLRFQHSFGSGYQSENIRNKSLVKDLAKAQLERKKLEFKDQEEDLKRRLISTYSIFQSSQNQRNLREKASQELLKTYQQGRTDISILIDAMNKFFDSEAAASRTLADYQIAWAQWQALQDQLVPGTSLGN